MKREDIFLYLVMAKPLKHIRTLVRMNGWKGKSLLVMAHKYSCREGHIYPVGIYKSPEACARCVDRIMYDRGGRYGVIVYVSLPNEPHNDDDKRLVEIYRIDSPYKGKLKCNIDY